jgi:hypothetical protein
VERAQQLLRHGLGFSRLCGQCFVSELPLE